MSRRLIFSATGIAIIAFFGLCALLTLFVTPSLVAAIEQVRPLREDKLVRAYLLLPVVLAWLIAAIGFVETPVERLQPKVLFGTFVIAFTVVLVVLVGDPQDLTSETSKITYFTSVTLIFAGAAALLNFLGHHYALHNPWLLRLFWLAMGLAFIFAALDEQFVLHEKVQVFVERASGSTKSAKIAGDSVTLIYALAALITIGLVYRFIVPLLIVPGQWFHRVFLAAACVYAASTLLDSLDFLLSPLSTHIDLVYMANAIEEIFEFSAASLFAAAFFIALLECNGGWLLQKATGALASRPAPLRPVLRASVYVTAIVFAGVAIALPFLMPADGRVIIEDESYDVQRFVGDAQGLLRPDGVFFHNGRLYVADSIAGNVRVFDQVQDSATILDGAAGLVTPESVAVDAHGTIFVTDDTTNVVFAIDGSGVLQRLGSEDGLRSPKGLTVGPDGALLISDSESANIYRYADDQLTIFATPLQLLSNPEEMAFDRAGNLYITEEQEKHVVKIAPDGTAEIFIDETSRLLSPEAIAIKNDSIYISDAKRGAIFRFDLEGRGGEIIHFTNRYRNLEGIALSDDGAIYVASRRNGPVPGSIFKITPHKGDEDTGVLDNED